MNYVMYALVGFPLLGAVFAVTRMLPAKKLSEGDGVFMRDEDKSLVNGKFFVAVATVLSSLVYGIMEFILVWQQYGFSVPEELKYPCIIGFVCNTAACILKGIIGEREIEKGMLYSNEAFTKGIVKMCVAEVVAIMGIMYFFMNLVGVV